uniref:Phytanoyl-CoA dioxygenase n=1 Tax=Peronospora matthiolae TaxID=2874970 RepID=A0AAV1UGJ7_9STRA
MAVETGAVIQATHVSSGYSFRALVERGNHSEFLTTCLCSTEKPYEKLKVALNGQVSWSQTTAKFALFLVELEANREGDGYTFLAHFKAMAHQKKVSRSQSTGWYLGATKSGLLGDAGKGHESLFQLTVISPRAAFVVDTARSMVPSSKHLSILCESQRRSFMQNGYLQIRGAVALPLVNAALKRINHDLGIPRRLIEGGVEGSVKLAGNTSNSDAILDIYYLSNVRKYVEAIVGVDQVVAPQGAQVALRFPDLGEPREPLGTEWHTDGMRQGRRHPFSLLAGVALSNVAEPLSGNFTVFPGSHAFLHNRLAANGKLDDHDDECYKADSVWGDGTLPDLGIPVQLLAGRGDLVLAHPDLAHRGGLNFSPDIRYQVYFRIRHKALDDLQEACIADLWADLEGLSLDK